MRIPFDQGTPAPLRRAFAGHSVSTAYEEGWNTLTNGELLAEAERSFDVFVTTDQNLFYQQNLAGRRLAILVLPTTSWPRLQPHAIAIATAVLATSLAADSPRVFDPPPLRHGRRHAPRSATPR